jgi:hypothetical protein
MCAENGPASFSNNKEIINGPIANTGIEILHDGDRMLQGIGVVAILMNLWR